MLGAALVQAGATGGSQAAGGGRRQRELGGAAGEPQCHAPACGQPSPGMSSPQQEACQSGADEPPGAGHSAVQRQGVPAAPPGVAATAATSAWADRSRAPSTAAFALSDKATTQPRGPGLLRFGGSKTKAQSVAAARPPCPLPPASSQTAPELRLGSLPAGLARCRAPMRCSMSGSRHPGETPGERSPSAALPHLVLHWGAQRAAITTACVIQGAHWEKGGAEKWAQGVLHKGDGWRGQKAVQQCWVNQLCRVSEGRQGNFGFSVQNNRTGGALV